MQEVAMEQSTFQMVENDFNDFGPAGGKTAQQGLPHAEM